MDLVGAALLLAAFMAQAVAVVVTLEEKRAEGKRVAGKRSAAGWVGVDRWGRR